MFPLRFLRHTALFTAFTWICVAICSAFDPPSWVACVGPTSQSSAICKDKAPCHALTACISEPWSCGDSSCNPVPGAPVSICPYAKYTDSIHIGWCDSPLGGLGSGLTGVNSTCLGCSIIWCTKGTMYKDRDLNGECIGSACTFLGGFSNRCYETIGP